jgi:hypothetical protein
LKRSPDAIPDSEKYRPLQPGINGFAHLRGIKYLKFLEENDDSAGFMLRGIARNGWDR